MSTDMKDYEAVKSVGSGKKTPIVQITKSGDGAFLKGVLVRKSTKVEYEFDPKSGDKVEKKTLIATFRLIETSAVLIMKNAQGYAPVTNVAPGSEVTIYGAPTRLRQALDTIAADGTQEVFIVYEGKKKEVFANGKAGSVHKFAVGKRTVAVAVAVAEEMPD